LVALLKALPALFLLAFALPTPFQRYTNAIPPSFLLPQQFPQNTFQCNNFLVCCMRYSVGRCSNFVAPSKWKAVQRPAEYFLLEGDLQEDEPQQ
jgi:hypothetical protein